jgi:two-component system sensor histidine kinase KdpD
MTTGGDYSGVPEAVERPERKFTGYLAAVLTTAAVTAVGWPLHHRFGLTSTDVLMLYLLGVLWVATRYSRSAAIVASAVGVAAFDFFFVPPYLTFVVSHRQYVVTFVVMVVAALVISSLTHRVRMQAAAAEERARRTQMLLALSRELAAARTGDEIVAATTRHVAGAVGGRTVLLLADGQGRLSLKGDSDGSFVLPGPELSAAERSAGNEQAGGGETAAAKGRYFPLKASRGTVGVVGVFPGAARRERHAEQWQLVEGFASQVALAVERASLGEEARAAWERVETEFLRNTLLSGVSHDLRTPLTAITGAASTLIQTRDQLKPEAETELLETIYSESERMERLIGKLLDMTRLESGGLALRKEWQPFQEVVGSALHHLERRLTGRPVRTHLPADLPLLRMDAVAMEQVLVNLLENAVDHTPGNAPIEISAKAADGEVVVEVADEGPGLPRGAEERVFEKFFRAAPEGRKGIGLGLAISRGIVEAHGGTISAANRAGGGAAFRFTLPRTDAPPAVDGSA